MDSLQLAQLEWDWDPTYPDDSFAMEMPSIRLPRREPPLFSLGSTSHRVVFDGRRTTHDKSIITPTK